MTSTLSCTTAKSSTRFARMTTANLLPTVAGAIDELQAEFPDATVTIEPDGQGGARVCVDRSSYIRHDFSQPPGSDSISRSSIRIPISIHTMFAPISLVNGTL